MTYYQFIQTIEEKMKKELKDRVCISIYTAQKCNGTVRRGLLFTEQGSNVSPAVYLEEYYQRFLKGGAIDEMVTEILYLYIKLCFEEPWKKTVIRDYAGVKEKIVYRLVHRERNQEMLKDMPYIPYFDLAVVFYVLFEAGTYGVASMPVQAEHLRQWGITKEQAYQCACVNTCRLLPPEFNSMSSVMEELSGTQAGGEEEVLFVLSNQFRNFGAAAVLYPGELEKIGAYLGEDYFVIPSSVHEMLVARESAVLGKHSLGMMVAEINGAHVAAEEVLSDNVYYYDRAKRELVL